MLEVLTGAVLLAVLAAAIGYIAGKLYSIYTVEGDKSDTL